MQSLPQGQEMQLGQNCITYLGLIIEQGKIQMDPMKTEVITSWLTQQRKKNYSHFSVFSISTNDFYETSQNYPLTNLTRKASHFEALKKTVTNDPALALPNRNGKFMTKCNASDFAMRAVLSQVQDNKTFQPITFISHSMTPAEQNYNIHDKELLAIICCFKTWQSFLLGSGFLLPINVYSHHENLMYFQQAQDLTSLMDHIPVRLQLQDLSLKRLTEQKSQLVITMSWTQ